MTPTGNAGAWRGFKPGLWQRDVNVRWFIQQNYTPYAGDAAFLAPPTERTRHIWKRMEDLFIEERKKGVLDVSPMLVGKQMQFFGLPSSPLISGMWSGWTYWRSINWDASSGRNSGWIMNCGTPNRLRRQKSRRQSPGSARGG
jgi:hypothetical protein